MMILSPSYKRAQSCITHKLLPGVKYVVHESEEKEYRAEGHEVVVAPDKIKGNIARVRNWILGYGEKAKEKKLLMLDDDLEGLDYWEGNERKRMSPQWVEEFVENGFDMAEQAGVKLWGTNIVQDKGSYREYTPFAFKSYISGSFSGHLLPTERYDERFSLKEDYDFTIHMLNKYRKVLRFNFVHYRSRHLTMEGGCATYRLVEREKEQLERLQRKWGDQIVKFDKKADGRLDTNPIVRVPIGGV